MHFYAHNIGDFAIQTRGLTYEQIGIYITLLDQYASTEKPIPEDWVALAYQGQSKCLAIALLKGLFVKQEDGWVHLGLQETISEYLSIAEKRRKSGRKGGKSRGGDAQKSGVSDGSKQTLSKCQANASQPIPINHNPLTNNQEEGVGAFAPRTASPARRALTHPFDLEALPDSWREYCTQVRPDLDAEKVFADFRFYWRNGRGSDKRFSDKSWTSHWQTWVRKESESKAPVHQETPEEFGKRVAREMQEEERERQLSLQAMDGRNEYV